MLSPRAARTPRHASSRMLCIVGISLSLIGFAAVFLVWYPMQEYLSQVTGALKPRIFAASKPPLASTLPARQQPACTTPGQSAGAGSASHRSLQPRRAMHSAGSLQRVCSQRTRLGEQRAARADFAPKAFVEVRAAVPKRMQPNDTAPAPPVPFRSAPLDDKALEYRKDTVASGHGASVGLEWRGRRPRDIADDQLVESEYLLNATTMREIADRDGYIMVTWANDHYFDFVRNWAEHVEALGISAYVVGAMDNQILGRLVRAGMPCFAMQSGLTHEDFGWGSKNFHRMGRKKIKLVQLFTEMDLTVLISDVDTVWLRSPFEYMKRYPEADILTSSDHLAPTTPDGGLESGVLASSAYNIGIMMFSPRSREFARLWVEWIERDDDVWDQNAFNTLVRQGMRFPQRNEALFDSRLFYGANGTLVVGVLPVATFASGHTFFVSRLHERLRLEPYVVHATFQFSGTAGKRNRFREATLWNDPPAYYDPGHAFVTWDMDVPDALLNASYPRMPTERCCEAQRGHFDLVNDQLLQLRHGLAVASALGAGIVVPQFMAGQDRWWAPHKGRLPQAPTELPYAAPLDHVVDLEKGLGVDKSEAEFGPNIPYREYSFLQNSRMPEHVRRSVLAVEPCTGGDGCGDGSGPAAIANDTVRLRPGLSDVQLRTALGDALASYSFIRFERMAGAFSQHAVKADWDKFTRRTAQMATIWCCVKPPPGTPGHVWYDMWWDVIPHTDLHGRRWNESWEIVMGP